jgi:hypothetical protein
MRGGPSSSVLGAADAAPAASAAPDSTPPLMSSRRATGLPYTGRGEGGVHEEAPARAGGGGGQDTRARGAPAPPALTRGHTLRAAPRHARARSAAPPSRGRRPCTPPPSRRTCWPRRCRPRPPVPARAAPPRAARSERRAARRSPRCAVPRPGRSRSWPAERGGVRIAPRRPIGRGGRAGRAGAGRGGGGGTPAARRNPGGPPLTSCMAVPGVLAVWVRSGKSVSADRRGQSLKASGPGHHSPGSTRPPNATPVSRPAHAPKRLALPPSLSPARLRPSGP